MSSLITLFPLLVILFSFTTHAVDYPAQHCEIFIDRAGGFDNTYAYRGVILNVKILPSRLDGKVKQVGFYNHIMATPEANTFCSFHPSATECQKVWTWTTTSATQTANDYFVFSLKISSNYDFAHSFEGNFFVETDKGTVYWTTPGQGTNFIIDSNMKNNLDAVRGGMSYSPQATIVTAEKFPYLNPAKCY